MNIDDYQEAAIKTRIKLSDNASVSGAETKGAQVPLLMGLFAEVGSLAAHYRKHVRDGYKIDQLQSAIVEDLGDILWYVAAIATELRVKLSVVADKNISRVNDRYPINGPASDNDKMQDFEKEFLFVERFPRQWIFEFIESDNNEALKKVTVYIREAVERLDDGSTHTITSEGSLASKFQLSKSFGDSVDDNTYVDDAYRYHDALHIAFMAVLHWSPVVRGLTKIKRRSNKEFDRVEHGARARDLEEALSALLKEFSKKKNDFKDIRDIDTEVRDVIRLVVGTLEVKSVPIHKWATAIQTGFKLMKDLEQNKGGFLSVDLDERTVHFLKQWPTT